MADSQTKWLQVIASISALGLVYCVLANVNAYQAKSDLERRVESLEEKASGQAEFNKAIIGIFDEAGYPTKDLKKWTTPNRQSQPPALPPSHPLPSPWGPTNTAKLR